MKNLVQMHGGTVTATSEGAGKGSEFVVSLPKAATLAIDFVASEPLIHRVSPQGLQD